MTQPVSWDDDDAAEDDSVDPAEDDPIDPDDDSQFPVCYRENTKFFR
jgi:hypothetical protein